MNTTKTIVLGLCIACSAQAADVTFTPRREGLESILAIAEASDPFAQQIQEVVKLTGQGQHQASYDLLVHLTDTFTGHDERAVIYLLRGLILLRAAQFELAARNFDSACVEQAQDIGGSLTGTRRAPPEGVLWMLSAVATHLAGDLSGAELKYELAESRPGCPPALYLNRTALRIAQDRFDLAARDLEKALAAFPGDRIALYYQSELAKHTAPGETFRDPAFEVLPPEYRPRVH